MRLLRWHLANQIDHVVLVNPDRIAWILPVRASCNGGTEIHFGNDDEGLTVREALDDVVRAIACTPEAR